MLQVYQAKILHHPKEKGWVRFCPHHSSITDMFMSHESIMHEKSNLVNVV